MMDLDSTWTILSLAFGLGLLHALDADHVMAATGLASTRPGLRTSLAFCSRWAVGHGLALCGIGVAVLLLGMAVPATVSAWAEDLVGIVLIAIGATVFWELRRQRTHLHFHRHDGLAPHAHWHRHPTHNSTTHAAHQHQHRAVLIGVLHGTAGSAPLLALLPLARLGHTPWVGLLYLGVFALGVLGAMLLFGGALGATYGVLRRRGDAVVRRLRGLVATASIAYGAYLLYGVV